MVQHHRKPSVSTEGYFVYRRLTIKTYTMDAAKRTGRPKVPPRAHIYKMDKGPTYGRFYFTLFGGGAVPEIVGGSGGQTYEAKASAKKILKKYFPNFEVVDETIPTKK